MSIECRLCEHKCCKEYCRSNVATFFQCPHCKLVIKDPSTWLSPKQEKARYSLHNNDPKDSRYIEFLNQLILPVLPLLKESYRGLDFGCGPSKAIEYTLKEKNFEIVSYDPFFHSDTKILIKEHYDFITCSEVLEHLHKPQHTLTEMLSYLKPSGFLACMTREYPYTVKDFSSWWYTKDPTHVVFYCDETFKIISRLFSLHIVERQENIVIFQK